ncbi:hypothetical protein MKW94_001243, partial [Papaver nudicaule]|nr:hypothetical protein [Papaver nudicaule]
ICVPFATTKNPPIPVENTMKVDPNDSGAAAAGSKQEGIDEKCGATANKCTRNQKDMIACLLPIGLEEFFLLVQNEGETNLEANISVSASVKAGVKELQIQSTEPKRYGSCDHKLNAVSTYERGITTPKCKNPLYPLNFASSGWMDGWITTKQK